MSIHVSSSAHCRGFSVVEMLVVIMIVVIGMAFAMPLFQQAGTNAQRDSCRANMQALASAQRIYRLKDAGVIGHTPAYAQTVTSLKTRAQVSTVCPAGGTYSFTSADWTTGFTVHCSVSAHDLGASGEPAGFTPGVNTR